MNQPLTDANKTVTTGHTTLSLEEATKLYGPPPEEIPVVDPEHLAPEVTIHE